MKSVFFLSLMSLTSFSWAAHDWKVVAETTTACKEKIQVLAKEGETFVYINDGASKIKLKSEDGSAFNSQSGKSVTYTNTHDKLISENSKRFTFIQPSVVDGNPPKLDIVENRSTDKCNMTLR